jgi:putative selenate reductase
VPGTGPLPFGRLITHALTEIESGAVAKGSKTHDLSVDFHGKTVSTPFAPLGAVYATDLVTAYLRGARILEIDAGAQPLLDEYLLASMTLELLLASGDIPIDPGFDFVAFDVTLRSSLVSDAGAHALLRGMADSRAAVNSLRADIPAGYAKYRTLAFRTRLSDTVTLAAEPNVPLAASEAALSFLLQGLGVSCQWELSPSEAAWTEAVPVLERAGAIADDLGLSFGVKARTLDSLARVRDRFGDRFPITFGGNLMRPQIPETIGLGVAAIGIPLDHLMFCVPDLCARMDAAGSAENMGDFVLKLRYGNGDAALETAAKACGTDDEMRRAAKAALAHSAPSAIVPRELYDRWVSETKLLNTKSLVAPRTAVV